MLAFQDQSHSVSEGSYGPVSLGGCLNVKRTGTKPKQNQNVHAILFSAVWGSFAVCPKLPETKSHASFGFVLVLVLHVGSSLALL